MEKHKLTVQLVLGCVLCIAGLTLLFIGCFLPPVGEIHNSMLIAFGEVSTFSGALIGVDYHYKFKEYQKNNQ